MDLYTQTSYQLAKKLTKQFSTSFSQSSNLFAASIRNHIYAIYGLVRIADEIVDTYQGPDMQTLLDSLECEVYRCVNQANPFSANPIVHAFALTAQHYHIEADLIKPFFASMRTDITEKIFTKEAYDAYIYGSAEVIGLMCLRIFCDATPSNYELLKPGALALGRAYQNINFLRDINADHTERGRWYFPFSSFETFSVNDKQAIEQSIDNDLTLAKTFINALPTSARKAVRLSYHYYDALLDQIKSSTVDELRRTRIRIPDAYKSILLIRGVLGR